jgi:hypothetical protein
MRRPALSLVIAILTACASPAESVSPSSPEVVQSADASSSADTSVSALDLLDCDGDVASTGGAGAGLAIDGGAGGATPDQALAAFLAGTPYAVPRNDYVLLGVSGDRYAYGYRAGDKVKVVVVMSPRYADVIGAAFAPDELRACPESEFGSGAQFGDGRRVWTNAETGAIITDIPGPGHCGWQSARMMHLERDGGLWKQYLRDPEGVFAGVPLMETYAEGVELPADAADSGYRSPEGDELWFTETDTAAYVVTGHGVERWPRATEPVGCT